MNDNMKIEKPLGLPPMELAEGSTYSNRENSAAIAQKCFHPWLKRVIGTIMLTVIAVGTYVVLLRILQTTDNIRGSEIIIVTDLQNSPNITVQQKNIEVFLQIKNKTSHRPKRKRRSLNVKEISKAFNLHEDVVEKAREVIMSHDEPCTSENRDAVCKDIVTKLEMVNQKRSTTDGRSEANNSDNMELNLRGQHVEKDEKPSRNEKNTENLRIFPEVHEDQLLQRHAHPEFHHIENSNYYANGPHDFVSDLPVQQPFQIPAPPITDTCLLARLLKQNPQQFQGLYDVPVSYLPQQTYHPVASQAFPSYSHSQYPQSRLDTPDVQERRPHPQDIDIFMRFHSSERPTASFKEPDASTREAECQVGSVSCDDGDSCIAQKQWCDGIVDCADASDEARCTCKSRVDKARLCDGYFDCPLGEDEMGCFGCFGDTYSCEDLDLNSRGTCFAREQRCDNNIDCLGTHKDELECNLLAPSLHDKPMFAVSNTEGFLQRNFRGTWFPVCNNPYMWAHDACRRETGLIIRPPYLQMLPIDPTLKMTYLNTGPGGVMQMADTCVNSSAVYVVCPDLLCGTRVASTPQILRENAAFENHMFGRNKRFLINGQPYTIVAPYYESRMKRQTNTTDLDSEDREEKLKSQMYSYLRDKRAETRVVGGRPSKPAAWPWVIALYRNGMFHCGGVVITQRWIVSAAHCVHKFWEHYYEIQVGMLRRFSFSPQESNHRVTHVIVNQNYDRIDMRNDLSLLRVKPAVQFSRWVRPICLPGPETAGPDWMWGPAAGTSCVAVGWGATVEHGPDPDHMREVEVPIWAQCRHREDRAGKEICAGPVEGGKDACQGDSGGPLLCRNPLNAQQWYMAGIVSHGDGCARKGEPGVYTRVSIFSKWIKYHIFAKTLPGIQPKHECPGFKCISGVSKCLPKKRMCDKIIDCLDGEDEMNCNFMRSAHEPEENLFETVEQKELKNEHLETKEAKIEPPVTYHNNDKVTTGRINDFETHIMDLLHKKSTTIKPNSVHENKANDIIHEKTQQKFVDLNSTSTANSSLPTSSEHSSSRDNSEENFTADPTEQREEKSRGDLQTFTVTESKESLESRSIVAQEREVNHSRETDIPENGNDTQTTTSIQEIETTTSPIKTEKKHEIQTTTTAEVLITDDKQTVETTETMPDTTKVMLENSNTIKGSTKLILETTTAISEGVTEIEKGTKAFSFDLPLDETEKPHKSNNTGLFSKTFPEPEREIVEKITDIVLSKLLPAKIKKKQHYPYNFECRRIYQNISYQQRCNHKADCEDGTDELGCTCVDYLATFDKKLLCDGTVDCADGEDEIHCYGCSEEQFLCKWSQTCLSIKHVCDGTPQCPQGEDELDCFALSNGKNIEIQFDGRPKINLEGYLTRKHENSWNIVCEDDLSLEQQEEAASHICRYLGFSSANRFHVKYISLKDEHIVKTDNLDLRRKREVSTVPITFMYQKTDEDLAKARHIVIDDPQIIKEQCVPNITKVCTSLYVTCEPTLFTDFADIDFEQNFLSARSNEKLESYIWPWIAQVFVEGDYKCSGILVDLSWVLVSSSCLWDLLLIQSYASVVLGSQRTLKASNGPYTQVYQVDGKKELYHNKVTLLHLKTPAHYSNMVKPMVVPPLKMHNHEKTAICVAIGQDNNNKTVNIFLEETEDHCELQNKCYIRHNPRPVCVRDATSQRPWAGIISCHGPDGWYPAASFVESHGECGVGHRITGLDIGNLRSDMKRVGKSLTESAEQTSPDECDGERCGRGRCVKFSKLCDGVNDCEDGTDEAEASCEKKLKVCGEDPHHRGCECTAGQLKCKNGRCISKERFGDGMDDCGDGSDEPGHVTCAQYLARVMPMRLCDGVLHCYDRSDEDPLFCKCFSNKFKCGASEHCVAPDIVCDGTPDCPNKEDEQTCIGLSAPDGTTYGTGQVIVRSHGVWHSKCFHKENHTRSELEQICRELGFISGHAKQLKMPEKSVLRTKVVLETFNEVVLNNITSIKLRNSDAPLARSVIEENTENCFPVFIECL